MAGLFTAVTTLRPAKNNKVCNADLIAFSSEKRAHYLWAIIDLLARRFHYDLSEQSDAVLRDSVSIRVLRARPDRLVIDKRRSTGG